MARLLVFVDLAFVEQALQHSLHDSFVQRIGRLRPLVVFHVEFFPKIDKFLRGFFDEFGWRHTGFRGRLLNFLTVLIDSGQEKNFLALQPMITRDHIGQDFFVSVTDVRRRVGVIDRRRDVESLCHAAKLPNSRTKRNRLSWQSCD